MFEFITISNGVAVVQHAPTGHVYRFRPIYPGQWHALTLDKVDAADVRGSGPGEHLGAALRFAEEVVSATCSGAAELPVLPEPARQGWPAFRLPRRFPLT